MKATQIVLAATLLATGSAAAAQSATDARCIVLATAFANQAKDANQQKIAEDSVYVYLGRINSQPTMAQMKAALDAQSKTLNDNNAGALMGDCVKAVQAKVQLLQSVAAQSQQEQPKPPAAKPPANPQGR